MSGHPECPRCGTYLDPDGTCGGCGDQADDNSTVAAPLGEMDGAGLLAALRESVIRYVVLPSAEAADAISLWIAATHAQPAWDAATRLVITAPEKRCGKSRLLDVIEATCHDPLVTVNISPAALVRSITADPPTILLDEADTVFGRKAADNHEDLRGLLNGGHQRNRPYIRWDAASRQLERCPTFAMAALAGIGDMPDTITDRAIVIRMRRRAPGEQVSTYRQRRDRPDLSRLGTWLREWIRSHVDSLAGVEPDSPVDDRDADNWESVLAVADLAGGDWPYRARAACIALTQEDAADTSAGTRLLTDLREVFGDADALHGSDLLDRLHKIEEAPWADWYGKPLDARHLARLVRPYGVTPSTVKIDGKSLKGYRREELYEVWRRYLDPAVAAATSVTVQVNDSPEVTGNGRDPLPVTSAPPPTREVAQATEATDTSRLCAECGEPLHPKLATAGDTTHPCCRPVNEEA